MIELNLAPRPSMAGYSFLPAKPEVDEGWSDLEAEGIIAPGGLGLFVRGHAKPSTKSLCLGGGPGGPCGGP